MAPAVVAVAAERPVPLPQQPEVAAVLRVLLPVLLLEVVVDLALLPAALLQVAALVALLLQLLAHKRLPLVLPRDVAALPQEAEVAAAAVVLQGLVASETLRNR